MELSARQKETFLTVLWEQYRLHGRPTLPWRIPEGASGTFDPYKIMVSELMLQQTQVGRVIPKYQVFLARFPHLGALAAARLGDVLRVWQGLGYNRRAKYLHEAARALLAKQAPWQYTDLLACRGIGPNTAAAVLTYSYNQPFGFVETNIRTVYIHHFFANQTNVSDREILALVEQTLDRENPREFYWALMDYGSYLKASIGNLNTASKQYVRQSRFEGSRRQIRGRIIRLLGGRPYTKRELLALVTDRRVPAVLGELQTEGLIHENKGVYSLE